ncbi:hypothetical protein AX16_009899 [Volvariella volvacea WC 439]|nr:hypothetical protein AX16_009899 [Volvariella volvacea WC 439]
MIPDSQLSSWYRFLELSSFTEMGLSDDGHTTNSSQSANVEDGQLLAALGYKQEFKREFSLFELFGFSFSITAIVPSISSVLFYSLPDGGPISMIWGWAASFVFLILIALAMAELGSSAPTSGGLYYWTYQFSPPRMRNPLSWVVGYTNTISYITGVAGVDFSCAVQIMVAASIASDLTFTPTIFQTYGVFCPILVCHVIIASMATKFLARSQYLFVTINIQLVLVILIGLPIATPLALKNSAGFTFRRFENITGWPDRCAFILGFLAPLWAAGGFDVGLHISEEAKNASIAVPWAVVINTAVGCVLGFGIQISLAFCMGPDMISILSSPIQQPMATILNNSFADRILKADICIQP